MNGHIIGLKTRPLKTLWQQVQADGCFSLAAEMAYSLAMSAAPLLIFLVSLLGLFLAEQDITTLSGRLAMWLVPGPAQGFVMELVSQVIREVIRGSSGGLAVLGIAVALYSASNAANVLIRAIRKAYAFNREPEPVGFLAGKLQAILLTLGFGLLVMAGFVTLAFGEMALRWLETTYSLPDILVGALHLARTLLPLAVFVVLTALVYARIARLECMGRPWYGHLPGAGFFVAALAALAFALNLYSTAVLAQSPLYGSLGLVPLLLLWLYVSAAALMLGGEINTFLMQRP